MRKLLRANFTRLWHDKIFLISCAFMFLTGVALPIIHCVDNRTNGAVWTPDSSFFGYALYAPVLIALVSALFVGSEYSAGAIRNKMIVGHRRCCIYLANLITCIAGGVLLCVAYAVPYTCLGLVLLGGFTSAPQTVLLYAVLYFALISAFSAVFVCISMLCTNRTYATAGCILLTIVLLIAGVVIVSALNEPEFYPAYSYSENGESVGEEEARNPNYLSGVKRQVYEFLYDFIPGGQVLQLVNMKAEKPAVLALYSIVILLVVSGCGLLAFRRKDLK